MTGIRRKARVIALKALYEVDSVGHEVEAVTARLIAEGKLSEDNSNFVHELVIGVIENKQDIDNNIQKFAPSWPIKQVPLIDRNILRLAIFEIIFDNKVPVKVAINEAVELAKSFGNDNSSRFVNGVLGSVSVIVSRKKALEKGVESGNHL